MCILDLVSRDNLNYLKNNKFSNNLLSFLKVLDLLDQIL